MQPTYQLGTNCWKVSNIKKSYMGVNTLYCYNAYYQIFPASVHQFYVNILVFININPFFYINDQFALRYTVYILTKILPPVNYFYVLVWPSRENYFSWLICKNYFPVCIWLDFKVEKILKVAWIQFHHLEIMGGKFCLRCKGKTLLGIFHKLLKAKSLLTSPSNVLP